ncbi:MAG: LamG domain-containing protein [Phycisphaerae bacterium]|nr:LamG domain-containing protein [Phycisphaerae bacterium]
MAEKLLRSSLVVLLAALFVGASALVQPSAVAAAKDAPKTLDTDPHLVGWWKLDETSGETAADSSRHKRKGALKGGLSFDKDSAAGRIGKTIKLDGEDGYVEITKYKGVVGTKPRTVTAWVRTTSSEGQVISWGADDFGKMFTFCFIRGRLGVRPNGGYYYMNDPIHDDQWHHVALVIKEAELPNLHDDAVLYKDGVIAEIHDIGLLDLWPIDTGSDLDVRIGRGFKGLIDDVRIYDRVLSDEEVMVLFKLESDRPLSKPKK